jgi:acyl dehydratase
MLDVAAVTDWRFTPVEQAYTRRDAMLYALGLGFGAEPTDPQALRYVYEDGLVAFPTMAVVLGNPGPWTRDPRTGIDWVRTLHGEQGLVIHAPLPPEGRVIGTNRVTGIIDKGPGKGALLMQERELRDAGSGALLAVRSTTSFLRGDGGCGAPAREQPRPPAIPDRAPDVVQEIATRPEAALIYRLSGDWNPVHADPAVAARAGFERPILHGLCTYGIAGRAVVATICGGEPARLRELHVRFSAPVYPGETIRVELWEAGAEWRLRARVPSRDAVVLNNGRVVVA